MGGADAFDRRRFLKLFGVASVATVVGLNSTTLKAVEPSAPSVTSGETIDFVDKYEYRVALKSIVGDPTNLISTREFNFLTSVNVALKSIISPADDEGVNPTDGFDDDNTTENYQLLVGIGASALYDPNETPTTYQNSYLPTDESEGSIMIPNEVIVLGAAPTFTSNTSAIYTNIDSPPPETKPLLKLNNSLKSGSSTITIPTTGKNVSTDNSLGLTWEFLGYPATNQIKLYLNGYYDGKKHLNASISNCGYPPVDMSCACSIPQVKCTWSFYLVKRIRTEVWQNQTTGRVKISEGVWSSWTQY